MNLSKIYSGLKALTLKAWFWAGVCVALAVVITVPVMKRFIKITFAKIYSGLDAITLKGWLWAGACVVLAVVITVPVWQFMNTLDIINRPAENPSTTGIPTGLLGLQAEAPDATQFDASPNTPSSPGTPANPRPASVTQASTKDGTVPAKAASIDAGSKPSTFVITYTDYVTYFFNPPVINEMEVTGNDPFSVCVSADVTIVKDIPVKINSANLILTVYATHAAGSINIPLTISGNDVSFRMPDSKGETTTFSQQVILRFPQGTPGGRYHITMNISGLVVGTMFGDYSIGFGQPDVMYHLGYIEYRQSTP